MIYLKKFVLKLTDEKELKLHDYTKSSIRDIEREMEKNKDIEIDYVVKSLKKLDELSDFSGSEWKKIEKEVEKML